MYEQIHLLNGVRIVTEHVEGVRSVSVGVWIGTGSRHEKASEAGSAHFIEHMLFKGTESRSAMDIARQTDAIGGQINAFTTKECTCYYARVLDHHFKEAVDILYDMLYHSRFDERDVETECGVILEEIGMYRDTPDDLCAEQLSKQVYGTSALARPILGKATTLKKMTGETLKAYQKKHYVPQDTVVSISGSFSKDDIEYITARFKELEAKEGVSFKPTTYQKSIVTKRKNIEQNHLILAFPGESFLSQRRFALQLLSFVLGGGMSSRLFQELREKRGLCYSVYSYGASHADVGLFNIYTALNKDMEDKALSTIRQVVSEFAEKGPTTEEIERAREQSKANVLMGLESTQARMSHMGRSLLFTDEILSADDIIEAYDAVTKDDILKLSNDILRFEEASLSVVGKVSDKESYLELLR